MPSLPSSGTPTCVDDTAYVTASGDQATAIIQHAQTEAGIQTVIALWQRNTSRSIANMQDETAQEQMQMAEAIAAHAAAFWPEMKQLVDNAFSIGKQNNEYVSLPTAWGQIESENLSEGRDEWIAEQERLLCLTASQCEDIRWQRNSAMLMADMKNFAARQGEMRVQAVNDWRFELQATVLAIGQRASRGYMEFSRIAASAGTSAGQLLASGVNATMGAVGYFTAPKPIDFWASGIRQQLNTVYAPSTFNKTSSPVDANRTIDFSTPRIRALEDKPEPKQTPEGQSYQSNSWAPWSAR